jgi:hypothetical protein
MRPLLIGATIAALLLSALTVIFPPASPSRADQPAPACVWHDEFERTIRELGDEAAEWTVTDGPIMRHEAWGNEAAWGLVTRADGKAYINPAVPCRNVADVVRHEWMHRQQHRMYGPDHGDLELGASRVELVADCGSKLLGSTNTPYLQQRLAEDGVDCTAADLADARELIAYGR